MIYRVILLAVIGVYMTVNEASAAKLPAPKKCPTIVDLETNEYTKSTNKYKCFSSDVKAAANGYAAITQPSVAQKLQECSSNLGSTNSSLVACTAELSSCKSVVIPPPPSCPPPSVSPSGMVSIENIGMLSGAQIWSNDGSTYLGVLSTNAYDANSIANEFGNYGSEFSVTSIFNEFGTYGSEFSLSSAFNKITTTPPVVISGGKAVAYLTTNKYLSPRINSLVLKAWIKSGEY